MNSKRHYSRTEEELREHLAELEDRLQKAQKARLRMANHLEAAQRIGRKIVGKLEKTEAAHSERVSSGDYAVIQNGTSESVVEAEVQRLREEWEGEFLLDQPRRELIVNTHEKQETHRLGSGEVHFGLERVLVLAMKRPGRPFGHHSFEDEQGYSSVGSPGSLSRYIHDVRRLIGDDAQETKYLHSVSVDRVVSNSKSGYVFDDRWHYLVIPTCRRD